MAPGPTVATRRAASTRTSQCGDVDHGEGAGGASAPEDRAVGEALVVVAAAAGVDREAVAPAAGDAGPRFYDGRWGQEQCRPRRPWGGEAEVLDGGVEQGSVGHHRRCVDEPGRFSGRRREARDAADEAPVEGDRCIRIWVRVTSWVTFALWSAVQECLTPYVHIKYKRINFKITQALVSYSLSLMA